MTKIKTGGRGDTGIMLLELDDRLKDDGRYTKVNLGTKTPDNR